jgi:hypothetical protein
VIAVLPDPLATAQEWAALIIAIGGAFGVIFAGTAWLVRGATRTITEHFDDTIDQALDRKLDEKLPEIVGHVVDERLADVKLQLARNGGSTVADAVHDVRRELRTFASEMKAEMAGVLARLAAVERIQKEPS